MFKSKKNFTFFLVIIYALLDVSLANIPTGAQCLLRNGSSGTCVSIMSCSVVLEQVRQGTVRSNPPTVCSQTERTVCCPLPVTTTTTSTTTTARPIRISVKKCQEYGKNVRQIVKVPSLMLGGSPNEMIIDKCKHKSVSLIVGGTAASINEFPHQALLGYRDGEPSEWGCGGSLVSNKFVLTAAHCLYPRSFGAVKFVKLGMNSRSQDDSKVSTYGVDEIFQHPNYNAKTFNEDIGLLRLNASVTLNEFILPVCMPTKLHDNYKAVASGFGRTGYQQSGSEDLLKVTLEKFTQQECQQAFGNAIKVTNDTMLCYGHHTENKDSCSGDSGGPLQIYNDANVPCTYTQIGVVSFGLKQCGTVGYPGAYVNVYHYLDWIEGIVWSGEN